MPKIFSSRLSGSPKKRSHRAHGGIFFSDFMFISKKKKKVLRLNSATFLRDLCDIPERGTVNRSCLRFLAGNKNTNFWREKKRQNSQNFSAKMPEKILHFFALIGNTAHCGRLSCLGVIFHFLVAFHKMFLPFENLRPQHHIFATNFFKQFITLSWGLL